MKVWILAGQSNMQGYGFRSDMVEADPRVFSFNSCGEWVHAETPLQNHWESFTPVHKIICRKNLSKEQQGMSDAELAALQSQAKRCAGPGIPFANAMANALGEEIGIIPCAHGATSLEDWAPSHSTDTLFGGMLERVKRAGGEVCGLLWYQGENDTDTGEHAAQYDKNLTNWIQSVRTELGLPGLPVVIAQLAVYSGGPRCKNADRWDMVRQAQERVCRTVPGTVLVSTIDLELEDTIHLSSRSHIVLGRRMAQAFLRLNRDSSGKVVTPMMDHVEYLDIDPALGYVRIYCSGVVGKWTPDKLLGFTLREENGELPDGDFWIVSAIPDPDMPGAIRLALTYPLPRSMKIMYGAGVQPSCNVVDESGMALAAGTIVCPKFESGRES